MRYLIALLAATSVVSASYGPNLNYRSPSHMHPSLGISLHKVVKRHAAREAYEPNSLNFTHGVASGDPYADSVILWTRLAPMMDSVDSNSTTSGHVPLFNPVPIFKESNDLAPSQRPVCLEYQVASDQDLQNVVDHGQVFTSSDVDYTVKVEAQRLKPYTTYYYQFKACGSDMVSPVGRTKTAPAKDDLVSKISLAIYSCSNFPFGFFNAYWNPARKDSVDYVIHLGDYTYEYAGNGDYGNGSSIGRVPEPQRITYTLYDYRKRLATYRTDLDLLLNHQQYAWIPVWDDHGRFSGENPDHQLIEAEVADNTWRDGAAELNNTEASFVADGGISVDLRKMNAVRAYFEWMPIRQVEMDDNLRIWRSFAIGSLFDLIMLDTRQYDRSITDLYWNTYYVHEISNEASRSMMGSRQENWFYHQLAASQARSARWRVVGSQTVFSRINESIVYGSVNPLDYDAWDGYQANRNRTFATLYDGHIDNTLVLSGDSHANWVSDLVWLDTHPYNQASGTGAIGVEFAGTAVSSPCPYGANHSRDDLQPASRALVAANRELQWSELFFRGYYELTLTPETAVTQYFGLPDLSTRNAQEISLANFTVRAGENRLARDVDGLVGGGVVENGALKVGATMQTSLTHDTETGKWYR